MGEYRPNVAALMINKDGYLLICERLLNPGAWQFPNGGINEEKRKQLMNLGIHVGGWINGWMDRLVNGWMDRLVN